MSKDSVDQIDKNIEVQVKLVTEAKKRKKELKKQVNLKNEPVKFDYSKKASNSNSKKDENELVKDLSTSDNFNSAFVYEEEDEVYKKAEQITSEYEVNEKMEEKSKEVVEHTSEKTVEQEIEQTSEKTVELALEQTSEKTVELAIEQTSEQNMEKEDVLNETTSEQNNDLISPTDEKGIQIHEYDGLNMQVELDSNLLDDREIVVSVKQIRKNYGKTQVLKGIDLNIRRGEKVTLFGPNGAGKSTLTEIISQIKEPSSGRVEYAFGTNRKEIAKKIGIQFQETSYPYYFTVNDIIKFFADLSKVKLSKSEMQKLIVQFQLQGLEKNRADSLSGGQKQRLNILLAVMNQPELLLLDEVSTGLDVQARTKIKKFIKDYIEETNSTLILVSHNPDEIEYLTDRIVVIYDGIVFEDILIDEIMVKHGSFENYVEYLFLNKFKKNREER